MDNSLYFDDANAGPRRVSSHPRFVAVCASDFYYDSSDEYAPFGSREGAAELRRVESWYRSESPGSLADHTLAEWSDALGRPPADVLTVLKINDVGRFAAVSGYDLPSGADDYDYSCDQALVARALGQLKVTGRLEELLQTLALAALNRLRFVARLDDAWLETLRRMGEDLRSVEPEGAIR